MYITIRQHIPKKNISWEDLIEGLETLPKWNHRSNSSGTITRIVYNVKPELLEKANVNHLILRLEDFVHKYKYLYASPRGMLYRSFKIPKRNEGFRRINAPNPQLSNALYELKDILEKDFGALHHTAAFAYVKGRRCSDAIRKHQHNGSNWFMKLDFSNFFGSISPDFLMRMLSQSFPFSCVVRTERGKMALSKALDLCFLRGSLPQGTPISPLLTNLCMLPIDHRIFNELAHIRFVYTRYADDMLISCIQSFDAKQMQQTIEGILSEFRAPLHINRGKTRYGSRKGSNWNLGLMLNKDNDITVGHMNKKFFKAAVCNFILDEMNHKPWNRKEAERLQGIASYYQSIEPEYFNYVIAHLNHKFNCNFKSLMKKRLF